MSDDQDQTHWHAPSGNKNADIENRFNRSNA